MSPKLRGLAREVGWFLIEFACLLVPCLLVYRLGDAVLGHATGEGFYTSLVVAAYFAIAMRCKGISL